MQHNVTMLYAIFKLYFQNKLENLFKMATLYIFIYEYKYIFPYEFTSKI